ncbi:DUF3365 domain-containing protein [Hymenobacter sp. ASUV-10]|uniref:DUF3365 domain-containing protein n=1 Tax=Hymenobacter aranciens TaxID=3063996 RepID=A0ABT9B593_9BACT|nr:DUF3365 domain-containing protein [Hymenobacter sp. ASUV-10]MDO7873424.1 DUF3365 domain-containing protein [Hymenobacter sp. ASUV-10]
MNKTISYLPGRLASFTTGLLLLAACRPDQVEHLKDSKRIGIETANWEVKRIMPADLLRAARWAGDSLTATADTLLRRTLARELAAGGVARAAAFCRPEQFPLVDSLARVMQATASRRALPAAPADTARQASRPSNEQFVYERSITLNNSLCLHCHGSSLATTDAAFLQKNYPGRVPTGYALGQTIGRWQLSFRRPGVAEFYTMKTRKKWKPHKF